MSALPFPCSPHSVTHHVSGPDPPLEPMNLWSDVLGFERISKEASQTSVTGRPPLARNAFPAVCASLLDYLSARYFVQDLDLDVCCVLLDTPLNDIPGWANCEDPNCECFPFCGPEVFCCNHSALQMQHEGTREKMELNRCAVLPQDFVSKTGGRCRYNFGLRFENSLEEDCLKNAVHKDSKCLECFPD
ncbi:hypothetical protein CB1_002798020 [Camelus ferus]|nr:hypothetical protein CB1_002798020 [Camelus ferus]